MPYLLEDLVIDRVDLVDEGANSAAFIEVFKRKERENHMEFSEILSKLKPEHAEVIQGKVTELEDNVTTLTKSLNETTEQLTEANNKLTEATNTIDTLSKAKECDEECECDGEADDDGICKACGKPKKSASFDETNVLKSMPEAVREEFLKMRAQKEAAEEQVRKNAEEKANAEAVAKAATLKSLPVEQDKLVDIVKRCDAEVLDVLSAVAAAIDGTVLDEVGKSKSTDVDEDQWAKIEAKADEIAKRDSVTKQKAIAIAINENPELYREYLKGGAN